MSERDEIVVLADDCCATDRVIHEADHLAALADAQARLDILKASWDATTAALAEKDRRADEIAFKELKAFERYEERIEALTAENADLKARIQGMLDARRE